jgi:hypothetical protein
VKNVPVCKVTELLSKNLFLSIQEIELATPNQFLTVVGSMLIAIEKQCFVG